MNKALQRPEFQQGSWALAQALRPKPGETFTLQSKSRDKSYEMLVTPDGYVVHQGEGCEGEIFNGPLGCWHSKTGRKLDMTTAVTSYQAGALGEARQFSETDIDTLKATICKGASDSELKLFVATCQHTGLDPFMQQIHAVMRNTKVGDHWEQRMVIQIGINGYRLVAQRTGEMQGMDGPQWLYDGKTWEDLPREKDTPLAARCVIYRKGVERGFVSVCRWGAYVQTVNVNGKQQPNAMWARMGPEQLAKCSEALGLRRAFPAEMANLPLTPDYIDDEEVAMERQSFTPSPDAIEGSYINAPADLDDEVPGAPEDDDTTDIAPSSEAANEEAPAAAPSLEDTIKAVVAKLTDCKETWSGPDYMKLYSDLKQFMAEGATKFDYKQLTAEMAPACLAYLRERRGEQPLT